MRKSLIIMHLLSFLLLFFLLCWSCFYLTSFSSIWRTSFRIYFSAIKSLKCCLSESLSYIFNFERFFSLVLEFWAGTFLLILQKYCPVVFWLAVFWLEACSKFYLCSLVHNVALFLSLLFRWSLYNWFSIMWLWYMLWCHFLHVSSAWDSLSFLVYGVIYSFPQIWKTLAIISSKFLFVCLFFPFPSSPFSTMVTWLCSFFYILFLSSFWMVFCFWFSFHSSLKELNCLQC